MPRPFLTGLSALYLAYIAVMSVITFLVFSMDKVNARFRGRRVRERTLHSLSLSGGAFGGTMAMLILRHKTKKPIFWIVQISGMALHAFICIVIL